MIDMEDESADTEKGFVKRGQRTADEEEEYEEINRVISEQQRIRYIDGEESPRQIRYDLGPPLHRTMSTFSIHSVRSVRSGGRNIDPALAIPIQYRTLSFNISNTREKELADSKAAKEKAEKGMLDATHARGLP